MCIRDRDKKAEANLTVWLFGLHAVRDALENPNREKLTLMVTPNAQAKLEDAIAASGITPQVVDPRKFRPPLDPNSVHQGAVLEVKPLNWGRLEDVCIGDTTAPRVLLLDEPTEGIQPNVIQQIGDALRLLRTQGEMAIVLVEQNADFAYALGDSFIVVEGGRNGPRKLKADYTKDMLIADLAL